MNGPGNGNYVSDEIRSKQAEEDRRRAAQLSCKHPREIAKTMPDGIVMRFCPDCGHTTFDP